jgi:DNA-binding transcriptional MerR regulator
MRRPNPDQKSEPVVGPGWSEADFERVEREHGAGVSTQQVVELFEHHGEPLTEATFRKYVQLGLLPRSVRVGLKGKHRGSQGLYPATVVRQVELIRRLMAQGYTIAEIQQDVFLGGEIDGLGKQLTRVLEAMARAAGQREGAVADDVTSRAIAEAQALGDELIGRLRAIEQRLAMRARMARAAV